MRLPDGELEEWKRRAEAAGIKLAAWIRERCNEKEKETEAEAVQGFQGDYGVVEKRRDTTGGVQASGELGERKADKTCPHGIAKGWRCTLCGGIVK